jgi:hypothetical protein
MIENERYMMYEDEYDKLIELEEAERYYDER